MEGTAQTCAKCGTDVGAIKRFKDSRGRLFCEPCAAALCAKSTQQAHASVASTATAVVLDDDGTIKLADEPAAPLAPRTARLGSDGLEICPDCGAPLPAGRDICKACGFNRKTGFAIGKGAAVDATDPRPHTPKPCKKCGYDLTGLKTARCPECGTVNVRMARARDTESQTLKQMYIKPLIMAAIGVSIATLVYMLVGFGMSGGGGSFVSGIAYLLMYGISLVIGFIAYVGCSIAFVGFDEPIGVTFVRLGAVYALSDAATAVVNAVIPFGIGGLIVYSVFYLGLLMQIMELDWEDAWLVAGVTYFVQIAVKIALIYVWITYF